MQGGGGFYCYYFLVTKRTGGFRPIHNLSSLNTFLSVPKFRMETLSSILRVLHPGRWIVSLDLKDAYLYILIHSSHWRYLRFTLRNRAGEHDFLSMESSPFWPCHCPQSFYQTFGPCCGPSASTGMSDVSQVPYIDGIFYAHVSFRQACCTCDLNLRCYFELGFIINLSKSALVPAQVMLHLGALIDMAQGPVSPPPPPLEAVDWCVNSHCTLFKVYQPHRSFLSHDCAHGPGVTWFHPGVCSMPSSGDRVDGILPRYGPLCRFHLHPLSILMRDHFDTRVDRPSKVMLLLSPVSQSALGFWCWRDLVSQGVPPHPVTPSHILTMDASTYGWVVVYGLYG